MFCFLVQVSDKHFSRPVLLSIVGNVVVTTCFAFLGPLPFLPIEPSVPLIEGCVAMAGLGNALIIVRLSKAPFFYAMEKI